MFEATGYEFVEAWGAIDGLGAPISGTGEDAFASPTGMVLGPGGHIYVTDKNNHKVKVYSTTGDHQATWDFPDAAPNLIFPTDIAYDAVKEQFVVVGSSASELYFFKDDGSYANPTSIFFADGTGLTEAKDPHAVAVDSAGYLYVTDLDAHRIKKLDSVGNVQANWGATDATGDPVAGAGPGEFDNPYDIDFHDGRLYVADTNNGRIQVLKTDGTFVEEFSNYGTGPGQFETPREIAIDPLGNRYVTGIDQRVLKFDEEWNYITEWGEAGPNPGQFDDPEGLVLSAGGRVYVADQRNHRIQVFRPIQ